MSQHIPERPVDRLPRRRSERVQCAVGWLILLAGVVTLVLAAVASSAAYRSGLERIRQDAAARTTVVGVLLDDAAPVGSRSRPIRVSYVDQSGRSQVGQIPVTGSLLAGTPVRIEVDGDGRLGVEPPTRGDAVFSAVAVATAVALGGCLLLVFAWMGVRALVISRNCVAWEREWRLVEPQWSGRGTAAP